MPADYDELAWFYDRYWGARFHDAAAPVLERLLYARIAAPGPVLDVCCGSGHFTERLAGRGYRVLGVDASLAMLYLARARVPGAPFLCADVSRLAVTGAFPAAVSTFDSLNHVMSDTALDRTFAAIRAALAPGGLFVFDVNTEEAYTSEWGKSSALVEPDAALIVRGCYDACRATGETWVTMFRCHADGWRRSDVCVQQRPLSPDAVAQALDRAGFREIAVHRAGEVGMGGDIAVGRVFVEARRGGRVGSTGPASLAASHP